MTAATEYLARHHRNFIGGKWCDAQDGRTIASYDPATGQEHAQIPRSSAVDVASAVAAARTAFESNAWAQSKPADRQRLLLRLADRVEAAADELIELESRDNGKPLAEAEIDVNGALGYMRYMAGWATKIDGRTSNLSAPGAHFAYTLKEPVGVVGGIIPWNFPLGMACWKIVPALVTGCTVILKPAEQTSITALRLAELVQESGYPPGTVNVVTGLGHEAGAALAEHPGIDKIAFTGSTKIGKQIAAAAANNLVRSTLELGGKSPVLVLDDCDIDKAAAGAAAAIFFNQGQVCCAGSRLMVHEKIYDKVVAKVADLADAINLAPGTAPGCEMGPLVSDRQRNRVADYVRLGSEEGAEVATSRRTVEGPGYFLAPTVLADTSNDMRVVKEEIFGPVLVAAPMKDGADIAAIANDTPYGLGASIWSNDLSRVHKLVPKIKAGNVWVNTHNVVDPSLPFGGYKASGYGRELGPEQLDAYVQTKSVWMSL